MKYISRCVSRITHDDGSFDRCSGFLADDGQTYQTCGEPCRWVMGKSGEGDPPFLDAEDVVSEIKLLLLRQAK